MGEDFYADVFSPAIAMAHEDGKTYEEIRDSIRKDWKPSKRKSK
jgi:predicted RNase H-like HicB family nuclease